MLVIYLLYVSLKLSSVLKMGYALKPNLKFLNVISRVSTMSTSNVLDILNDSDVCLVVIVKMTLVTMVEEPTLQGRKVCCIRKTGNEETYESLLVA